MRSNFRALLTVEKKAGSIREFSVLKMKKSHADQVAHLLKCWGKLGRSYRKEIMSYAVPGAGPWVLYSITAAPLHWGLQNTGVAAARCSHY